MIFAIIAIGVIIILGVAGVIMFAWAKGVWVVVKKIIKGE
jgi:hypothetical protein